MSVPELSQGLLLNVFAAVAVLFLGNLYRLHRRVQEKLNNIPGPESKSWAGMPTFTLAHCHFT